MQVVVLFSENCSHVIGVATKVHVLLQYSASISALCKASHGCCIFFNQELICAAPNLGSLGHFLLETRFEASEH